MGETQRRSGLGNLAARAAQLGGELEVVSAPGAGTQLRWRVPLRS
jgi:signal transduction histidine kinase